MSVLSDLTFMKSKRVATQKTKQDSIVDMVNQAKVAVKPAAKPAVKSQPLAPIKKSNGGSKKSGNSGTCSGCNS